MSDNTDTTPGYCPNCGKPNDPKAVQQQGCCAHCREDLVPSDLDEKPPMRPRLRMKINLWHDPRDQDADIEKVSQYALRMLNHPNEDATNVEIAAGREASTVFLTLVDGKWSHDRLDALPRRVANDLERRYATNVELQKWFVEVHNTNDSG